MLPHDGKAVGELEVRGPWITGSYIENPNMPDPDAMKDKFRDGWLRTGDVAMISPDGFITLTDRAKDVIKSGGEWISSVDLENAIMGHPKVAEAAVIGVPDPKWEEVPKAYVVPRSGSALTGEDVIAWCQDNLAKFKVPKYVDVVEDLPRNDSGKVLKRLLRDPEGASSAAAMRA